jgi:ferrochelatase
VTTADVPFASAAARSGEPFATTPTAYDAILLASFGGPEGQDDVIPFLRNVTRGRGIPDERLELVSTHYRSFDGVSPINAQNRVLLEALEAEIARRGLNLPVYWGTGRFSPLPRARTARTRATVSTARTSPACSVPTTARASARATTR